MNVAPVVRRPRPARWTVLLAATTVLLLVGGVAPAAAAPPENDDWEQAQALTWVEAETERTIDVDADFPLVEATSEHQEPDHAGAPAQQSIWFEVPFVEPAPITASWTSTDPVRVAVYHVDYYSCPNDGEGCPSVGNLYAPRYVERTGSNELSFSHDDEWQSVYLVVDTDGSPDAVLTSLRLQQNKPDNDNFADARLITGRRGRSPYWGGTWEAGEPDPKAPSLWYRWTAPSSGFQTFGGAALDVFTGTELPSLRQVGSSSGGYDLWTVRDRTYLIRVRNYRGHPGGRLTWRPGTDNPNPAADFNRDGCEDAVVGAPGEDFGSAADAGAVVVRYGCGGRVETWHQGGDGLPTANESGDRFGAAVAAGDFDGDGYADLAVGVPGEDYGNHVNTGGVIILAGSSTGLTKTRTRNITQSAASGPLASNEAGDRFGTALTSRAVTGSKPVSPRTLPAELYIGVPGEDSDDGRDAGTVGVLRPLRRLASAIPYLSVNRELFSPSGAGTGSSLAAGGVFSRGPYADQPQWTAGLPRATAANGRPVAGAATYLYFDYRGDGTQVRVADLGRERNPRPRAGDRLGTAVAVAELTDGETFLVAGAPGRDVGSLRNAGMVFTYRVHYTGASIDGPIYTQASRGIPGTPQQGDQFGASMASGFFDTDTREDLVVGVPGEDVRGRVDAGAITVIHGDSPATVLHMDSAMMAGAAAAGDRFGTAVGAVDVNGDGLDEVLAGAPYQNIRGASNAGSTVLRFRLGTSRLFSASSTPGAAEPGDNFGAALLQ